MWIFLNNAFLSIVSPSKWDDVDACTHLKVRARFKGDIENVFPDAKVFETAKADYQYRAFVDRAEVALVVAQQLLATDYDNFKSSISKRDNDRHNTYLRVWDVMFQAQEVALEKRRPKKQQKRNAPHGVASSWKDPNGKPFGSYDPYDPANLWGGNRSK